MYLKVDLVIVGCGAAGAAAALVAADQGAKTLVLDLAPESHVGGNSRVSAQSILNASDAAALLQYLEALGLAQHIPKRRLEVWAESCALLPSWLSDLGIATQVTQAAAAEYPELQGASTLRKISVVEGSLWLALHSRLSRHDVTIWAQATVDGMQPGPRGIGVEVSCLCSDGERRRILSRHGIVLAPGGFAGSPEALRVYTSANATCTNSGSPYNKGGLLPLVTGMGARLSGMEWVVGPYLGFAAPGYSSAAPIVPLLDASVDPVVVGPDLARINTHRSSRHGYYLSAAGVHKASFPSRSWLLCSEAFLSCGPLVETSGRLRGGAGWARGVEGLPWSKDNSAEISRSWLRLCDLPRRQRDELRNDIKGQSTIGGEGRIFGLPLTSTVLNTQGGPVRDHASRILDHADRPIPGLFGAGEFGAIFQGPYQGSGNLADCLVSARLAVSAALGLTKG